MPPTVAAAGIGAAASIGGALLGASAQKKAAKKALGAQQAASGAQIQFAADTYNNNAQRLDPYNLSGQYAMGVLNGLLYGNNGPQAAPEMTPEQLAKAKEDWATNALEAMRPEITKSESWSKINAGKTAEEKLQIALSLSPSSSTQYPLYASYVASHPKPGEPGYGGFGAGGMSPITSAAANNAFDTFRDSTNYKFRMAEGLKGVQTGMGALGAFDSGATRKALENYSGNMAMGELGNYMAILQQQISQGAQAGGALAGVSLGTLQATNAANQAAADAAGNAALIKGNSTANLYGNIAGALGGLASSFGSVLGAGGGSGALSPLAAGYGQNTIANWGMTGISDPTAKTNVTLLYREEDGLGWYRFAYKWAPHDMQIGVMADEVLKLRPAAFVPSLMMAPDGKRYDGVDYGLLGSKYREELAA